jgi:hypothetical protein
MGVFERYLTLWVALCIVVGITLSRRAASDPVIATMSPAAGKGTLDTVIVPAQQDGFAYEAEPKSPLHHARPALRASILRGFETQSRLAEPDSVRGIRARLCGVDAPRWRAKEKDDQPVSAAPWITRPGRARPADARNAPGPWRGDRARAAAMRRVRLR